MKNIILIKLKGNYTIGHAKMKDEEIVEKVEHDMSNSLIFKVLLLIYNKKNCLTQKNVTE